jgi:transposase InsO family protein
MVGIDTDEGDSDSEEQTTPSVLMGHTQKGRRSNRFARRKQNDHKRLGILNLGWDVHELVNATRMDSVLGQLLNWKRKPHWCQVSALSPELKHYYYAFDCWRVDSNGLIWYRWVNSARSIQWKLVIPRSYVPKALYQLHNVPISGHLGFKRTYSGLKHAPIYWYGSIDDVRKHCKLCENCFIAKTGPKKFRADMVSWSAGFPLERIGMDIAGVFRETESHNKYIYVVQDYFTQYVVLIPVPDQKAETLVEALVTHVVSKIGIPKIIHSDQGIEFCSAVYTEMCKVLGIDETKTSSYRPLSNDMVERMNRVVGSMIRQFVDYTQSDWDMYLPLLSMAYNSTIHSSTGFSPNKLMFGRELHLPLDLVLPDPDFEGLFMRDILSSSAYHDKLETTLRLVYHCTKDHLKSAMLTQKHYYNNRARNRNFKIGDSVWFYNPTRIQGRSPNLDKAWQGPYGVVATYGPVLIEIRKGLRGKSKIIHVDKLAHTKTPMNMKWVHLVPKLHEGEEDFGGLTELFDGFPENKVTNKLPSSNLEPENPQNECSNVLTLDSNVSNQQQTDTKQESTQTDSMVKRTRSGMAYHIAFR